MLSTLGKIQHMTFEICFYFSPGNRFWQFMQIVSFAWNFKSCFLGKKKKSIISSLYAELAQKVIKVNIALDRALQLSQEGQLSVSGERMCTILVNGLED